MQLDLLKSTNKKFRRQVRNSRSTTIAFRLVYSEMPNRTTEILGPVVMDRRIWELRCRRYSEWFLSFHVKPVQFDFLVYLIVLGCDFAAHFELGLGFRYFCLVFLGLLIENFRKLRDLFIWCLNWLFFRDFLVRIPRDRFNDIVRALNH